MTTPSDKLRELLVGQFGEEPVVPDDLQVVKAEMWFGLDDEQLQQQSFLIVSIEGSMLTNSSDHARSVLAIPLQRFSSLVGQMVDAAVRPNGAPDEMVSWRWEEGEVDDG